MKALNTFDESRKEFGADMGVDGRRNNASDDGDDYARIDHTDALQG